MISYNLKFRKISPSKKILLEKEGEIILQDNGFRLKGKGANDKGDFILFSQLKDIYVSDESLDLLLFSREIFHLSYARGLFDEFLREFFRIRNMFLVEALFLKQGKFRDEFEAVFERSTNEGEPSIRSKAKVQLYDECLVLIPSDADAFSLPFSFITTYEFDELEYSLKIMMDTGDSLSLSGFGNDFESFQQQMEQAQSEMFMLLIKEFARYFISSPQDILMKLASLMRTGKAVRFDKLKKLDSELCTGIEKAVFKDDMFDKTLQPIKKNIDPKHLYLGLHMIDGHKEIYHFSAFFVLPEKNLLACSLGSYEGDVRKVQDTFFFLLDPDGHTATETQIARTILDLNQALTLLRFAADPLYKNSRELQKSMYSLAIRKLSFLSRLRNAFLGKCPSILPDLFQRNFKKVSSLASAKRKTVRN